MDLIVLVAAASVMGAIVAAMMAVYYGAAGPRANLSRRLGNILSETTAYESPIPNVEALRPKRLGRFPVISSLLEGKDSTAEMAARLERADVRLTVSEFVAVRVFLALILAGIAFLVMGSGLVGILTMVAAGFIGWLLPSIWLSITTSRRISKLDAQLPEALTLISNSIKAGFGLMQALDMAARELEYPISAEIRRTLHDINVGSATDVALQNMANRNGSEDLDIVITAMLIQQSSGGNLSEILDNVAHTMRERIRIRGEIKTLTAQQMLTGFVIGGLPFVMVFLFSLINPDYMEPLFTTGIGNVMLAGAAVLEFFGVMLIRRILAIEV
jgi:tight adherence protein B